MKLFYRNGKQVKLSQGDYIASGGQAKIYEKGGLGFKVYHNPKEMIPVGKITELAEISDPNINRPLDVLFDSSGKPVGYSMVYISNAWRLAEVIPMSFRRRNGITADQIRILVEKLRERFLSVHAGNALIVDANELNFLVSASFDEMYGIDTDSYQTRSYPATVIMPGIRDPLTINGAFSEMSDWYAYGILASLLWLGIHPYKGRDPDKLSLEDRMRENVSIFNKRIRLPRVVPPFDSIPLSHRRWLEAMFEKGERCPPPAPGVARAAVLTPQKIVGGDGVNVTQLVEYKKEIYFFAERLGVQVAVDVDGDLYLGAKVGDVELSRFVGFVFSPKLNRPLMALRNPPGLYDMVDRKPIDLPFDSTARVEVSDNRMHVMFNHSIYEIALTEYGNRILAAPSLLANCVRATRLYRGVAIQDVFGSMHVSLFPDSGIHHLVKLPELQEYAQIVDAMAIKNVLFVQAVKKGGGHNRLVFRFSYDKYPITYDVRVVRDPSVGLLNFLVLDSGVVVFHNEEEDLELFSRKEASSLLRVVSRPGLDDATLCQYQGKAAFWHANRVSRLEVR